ncbi:MAG TPA: NUDIX hydrolase [Candidatus Paceibacterota bacterium]|nr:NUDIX hydrolase [Candidatus Paceibacterota bacterium]
MEIKSTVVGKNGEPLPVFYRDVTSEKDFEGKKIDSIRAYCFYKGELVVVHEAEGRWGLPGGTVEEGEGVRDAARREVLEETNMRINKMRLVSIQEVVFPVGPPYHVVRVACLVEPMGDFKADPAGEVTAIKTINPSEIITLADSHWGEMANRMLERAIDSKNQMEAEVAFV